MIYDIREHMQEEIEEIKFDEWNENLIKHAGFLKFNALDYGPIAIVTWQDFDNFIAACHKAKELWGPKE